MRLPPAFGRSFAASGVLLAFGLAAPLAAQPARRAPRAEATIDEMAAPRREGYDRIIMQLPPLTPVRRGAQKAAPAVAPTAPAEASVAAPAPAQAAAAAAVDPRPERAPPPEPASQTEAPPARAVSETAAEAADSAPSAPAEEPAPVAQSAPAEPAPEAEPAPLAEAAAPPAAEAVDAPPAAESSVAAPVETPNVAEPVAPVAELPPPAAIPVEEEQSSGSWTDWALLLAFVAIGGLFAARRWKARRRPAPAAASVVAPPPAAAAKRGRLAAALVVLREKGVPAALALLSRLRELRRRKPASERDAEKVAEWAQISATLRARASSAVASAPQPEEAPGVVSEPPTAKADARRWDQDREDGVELLEPGSPGARALVMNARRKLQTVGQR